MSELTERITQVLREHQLAQRPANWETSYYCCCRQEFKTKLELFTHVAERIEAELSKPDPTLPTDEQILGSLVVPWPGAEQ